jgi:hypothetical protein
MKKLALLQLIFLCLVWSSPKGSGPRLGQSKKRTFSSESFARAYLLGDKSTLSYKAKKAHKVFHLQHILVPSGLHLSYLYFLFKFMPKKSLPWIKLLFGGAFQFLNGFLSLKRMSLFYIFRLKFTSSHSFYSTFLLDFLLGRFFESPLSFSLSFLFLGLFTFLTRERRFVLFFGLLSSQYLTSYILQSPFYLIGSLVGLCLTPFFTFLLPFLSIELIFPDFNYVSQFIDLLLSQSRWIENLKWTPGIESLLILLLSFFPSKNWLFLLFFYPINLWNFPTYLYKRKAFISPPPKAPIKMVHVPSGTISYYPSNLRCWSRIYPDGWSTHCKIKPQ